MQILTTQLADFQPEGRHAPVAVGEDPYGRMLPGIRGVRLAVLRVEAKFKYDDSNPVDHRCVRQRVTTQFSAPQMDTDLEKLQRRFPICARKRSVPR